MRRDPSDQPWTVLIVDDHRLIADVLAEQFRALSDVGQVDTAYDLNTAALALQRHRPDVVLLDDQLGTESGLDLIAQATRLSEPPVVLVMSATNAPEAIIEGLRAGADGWLLKNGDLQALFGATDSVRRGDLYLPKASLREVLGRLLGHDVGADATGSIAERVTERQLEVLRCLITGMTREEVAAHMFVSAHTVRTHVQNMLHEFGLHSTPQLVAAARAEGIEGYAALAPRAIARQPGLRPMVPAPRRSGSMTQANAARVRL